MSRYIIYAIKENNTKNIVYVGCTSQRLEERFKQHIKGDTTATHGFISARTHFPIIIDNADNKTDALNKEEFWTTYISRRFPLLNKRIAMNGMFGSDNLMYGKRHSDYSKHQISIHKKGAKLSMETKEKIKTATSGSNNPRSREVICENNGMKFDFIKSAARYFGINSTCIGLNCMGKIKYAGKYNGEELHWRYA